MKPGRDGMARPRLLVAPRRGAWIETLSSRKVWSLNINVAPRRGAWIETCKQVWGCVRRRSRTPQGCVD